MNIGGGSRFLSIVVAGVDECDLCKSALLLIDRVGPDRRRCFRDQIGPAPVGMDSQVTRAGAGLRGDRRRVIWYELATSRIELELQDLVAAEDRYISIPVCRIDIDAMSFRL